MKEERLLPVGTKVFDVRYGWGEIERVYTSDTFPLFARFHDYEVRTSYTLDGKVLEENLTPMLSLTEYNLETGGFTPISDYWTKPKVNNWGYFWDDSGNHGVHFGRLIDIDYEEEYPYASHIGSSWHNFSHEIPEHIKKQMEEQ